MRCAMSEGAAGAISHHLISLAPIHLTDRETADKGQSSRPPGTMTPAPFAPGMMGVVAVFGMLAPAAVEGHGFVIEPISRQYLRSKEFNDGDEYYVEKWAGSFNGGGADAVQARTIDNIDPDVLADYGGGDVWIVGAAWDKGERCPNNNYLESDKIAVGHGVCGDPPQGGLDNPNTYSTPNTLWPPISTYQSGSIIELKAVINNNHWGHIEYFLCDTADMDDPDGVVTQDCLNMYPLDRDETDWWNSPIDPDYPGRFFVNPECRGETGETDQTGRPMLNDGEVGLDNGYINVGRYHLPNIQCEHCVLQMKYYAYVGCHHPGYHEFEPEWPGDCAPDKEDWLPHKNPGCSDEGQKWGNVFFGCSDITLAKHPPRLPRHPRRALNLNRLLSQHRNRLPNRRLINPRTDSRAYSRIDANHRTDS
ncbi:unnamed protein product [Ectocarpus sp. CCAP 1310/34]|nr:unnamed protein product [Ectocarpus sp. CCAP 1310/34]